MSDAFQRNFGAAQRARERRLGMMVDDPGSAHDLAQSAYSGSAWDAFFGSLQEQEAAARAAGLNYRVDYSGMGRGAGRLPLGFSVDGAPSTADEQTARTIAMNEYLADTNERRKANEIGLKNALDARQQDALNQMWTGYLNQVQASEQPSAPMDVQKFVSPGQSDAYRIRPAVLTEEQQVARMNPMQRAAYHKEKAAMDLAQRAADRADAALDLERDKTLMGGGTKPLTATAESNLLNRLTNQWTKANESQTALTRSLNIMRTGLDRFEADPNGASQAVLVTFQKILDPESVVRESEYARSAQGISVLSRIRGGLDKLQRGGAGVPKSELDEMVKTATQFIENTKGATTSARKRIGATLDRYNLPHELVFSEGATPTDVSVPSAPASPPSPGTVARANPFRR